MENKTAAGPILIMENVVVVGDKVMQLNGSKSKSRKRIRMGKAAERKKALGLEGEAQSQATPTENSTPKSGKVASKNSASKSRKKSSSNKSKEAENDTPKSKQPDKKTPGSKKKARDQKSTPQKPRRNYFKTYMDKEMVDAELAKGNLVKGTIRVNPRNREHCWIDNLSGDGLSDFLVQGARDRNRALNGDVVVLKLKPKKYWLMRDSTLQEWQIENGAEPENTALDQVVEEIKDAFEQIEIEDDGEDSDEALETATEDDVKNPPSSMTGKVAYSREMMMKVKSEMSWDMLSDWLARLLSVNEKMSEQNQHATADDSQLSQLLTCKYSVTPQKDTPLKRAKRTPNNPRRSNFHLQAVIETEQPIPENLLQRTAEVVFICERKANACKIVGQLKPLTGKNPMLALFVPLDFRVPRVVIPVAQIPKEFRERPADFENFLFVAEILDDWPENTQYARGQLVKSLGQFGDIEAETEGLLICNNIDTREFPLQALKSSLPFKIEKKWKIRQKELDYRRDFRSETVFTIDPITARDLDDALHVKRSTTKDGTECWEVGVHIADVSHFVLPDTELDKWAAERGTSVYLVHKVIPMLPGVLCEELCSLNPGVSRLTFSVVWKLDEAGKILEEWFGRSIIESCVKMAYEHAQEIIDNPVDLPPSLLFDNALPEIFCGKSIVEVRQAVLNLDRIAKLLKAKRVENGAIRLDSSKLKFRLAESTGLPYGICLDERSDANYLVEEFMLLANMSVAKKIHASFPDIALLRRHPPPKPKVLAEMIERCQKHLSVAMKCSSSKEISEGMQAYEDDPDLKCTLLPLLRQRVMRAMQLAMYFCTGCIDSESDFRHYALSVPFYTHFTSPIRRYPDVIVHRLLAASLGLMDKPDYTSKQVQSITNRCNDTKVAAKAVSDGSADVFFGAFIKEVGKFETLGIVTCVYDFSFDVLLLKYGLARRVQLKTLDFVQRSQYSKAYSKLTLFFEDPQTAGVQAKQEISVTSIVRVVLNTSNDSTRYFATITPTPDSRKIALSDVRDELQRCG